MMIALHTQHASLARVVRDAMHGAAAGSDVRQPLSSLRDRQRSPTSDRACVVVRTSVHLLHSDHSHGSTVLNHGSLIGCGQSRRSVA